MTLILIYDGLLFPWFILSSDTLTATGGRFIISYLTQMFIAIFRSYGLYGFYLLGYITDVIAAFFFSLLSFVFMSFLCICYCSDSNTIDCMPYEFTLMSNLSDGS